MERRVVITGIGPVTSIGVGKEKFIDNLFKQKTNIIPIPKEWNEKYLFKSRYYVPEPNLKLGDFEIPSSIELAMEKSSKLAIIGTKLALADAGLSIEKADKYFKVKDINDKASIIIGTGMSSLQTAFDSYVSHIDNNSTNRFNRLVIPMLMTNSPAAWISILFGITGSSYTINSSCASGNVAIGEAYTKIKDGYTDTVITGGVEVLSEDNGAVMRGFDMLSTLTKSEDGIPRPFSNIRSGFLFNAGAGCILILEELKSAISRGARIYAEIEDYKANSDSFNIAQIDPSGKQILELMSTISKNKKIDYINTHGTGTIPNDGVESNIIKKVFGDRKNQPYLNSSKGILGHSIGASGALEAAITAFSIYESKIHANLINDPMDNLNLPLENIECEINKALSMSYGFGGHNSALLLKRYQKHE